MSTVPKVSVGMPVYNGERHLRTALESILGQDFEDFELIISDNASTDATPEICADYAARDKRIRYYRNESNIGATRNYNRVFELAHGVFFKWLSHDDECYPSMLRRCVSIMDQASESVALVYPQTRIIDETGSDRGRAWDSMETKAGEPHKRLGCMLFNVVFCHPLWGLIRSMHLRRTRGLVGCISNDFVLLAELAMLGQLWEIPEPLLRLRRHPGNASSINPDNRAHLEWLDPTWSKKKSRLSLSRDLRLYLEYLKSAYYLPISASEKMLCSLTATVVPPWRRILRVTGGKQTLRRIFKVGNTAVTLK